MKSIRFLREAELDTSHAAVCLRAVVDGQRMVFWVSVDFLDQHYHTPSDWPDVVFDRNRRDIEDFVTRGVQNGTLVGRSVAI
ncbi:MAG: DUF1488 family protein [Planctomyces sp.]|nr:DUF1488 family protein [Planctomyces sp.]